MAGAPKGNQNARKGKAWREALTKALKQYVDPNHVGPDGTPDPIGRGEALARIARRVVRMALEGDFDAIEEIANRLDGKPPQAIVGDEDGDPIRIARIERVIVRANAQTSGS
jgi:hypothetical protein